MSDLDKGIGPLHLSQVNFGYLDARNEILADKRDDKNMFELSFYVPESVNVEDFHNRKYYFITGLKGSGKTALLHFIANDASRKSFQTKFIFFKSDISEDDRQLMSRDVGFNIVEDGKNYRGIEQDYEDAWVWFFHKNFYFSLKNNLQEIVINDKNLSNYLSLIEDGLKSQNTKDKRHFFPRFKDGKVGLDASISVVKASLEANFEWPEVGKKVSMAQFLQTANELFSRVRKKEKRLCIYVDELEVYYGNDEQYKRDCRMIRDLIIVISKLNRIFIENDVPISILCAIRSEILTAVSSLGKEINKPSTDFGFPIKWHHRGSDKSHPLLRIIEKKIQASEKSAGLDFVTRDVWNTYFSNFIHGESAQKFILHNTWYKPRDIVRLFSLSAKVRPDEYMFSQYVFDQSAELYSKDSWVELTEELQAGYSQEEIAAMKYLISGISRRFTFEKYQLQSVEKQRRYKIVGALLEKRQLENILEDLFRIGVIGNVYRSSRGGEVRNRWSFRGDEDVFLHKQMAVHKGLWNTLSVVG